MPSPHIDMVRHGFELWNRGGNAPHPETRLAALQEMVAAYHPDAEIDC